MNRCSVTYEEIEEGRYSKKGMRMFSTGMRDIKLLEIPADPETDEILNQNIYFGEPKPTSSSIDHNPEGQVAIYLPDAADLELIQNEDVTRKIFELGGAKVAEGGLLHAQTGKFVLGIRLPEAKGKKSRWPIESLADDEDLALEEVIASMYEVLSFPMVEFRELLRRLYIGFLTASPMCGVFRLKSQETKGLNALRPLEIQLNTHLHTASFPDLSYEGEPLENHFSEVMPNIASELFGLPEKVSKQIVTEISGILPSIYQLVEACFLSLEMKEEYLLTIDERWSQAGF